MRDLDGASASLTINKAYRGTVRQSGKLVRELCSAFTMYAEKMMYSNQGSIMDIATLPT